MPEEMDRRKDKRLPIELQLEINHMFRQGNQIIDNMEARIEVVNISKSGVGFVSEAVLPLQFYFNVRIKLCEKEFFYAVVKIIRKQKTEEEKYEYGAEFVGLAPFLADKIDVYENSLSEKAVN